ncbi:FAD-dependent oxidoreductase [Sphingopyxis panaciterrulae]|uniref:3-(3-hydroxy-phenyl)propionate hydroxylase n=1 Tax=Sphingopyxis panaciterrulae TaxID=462372 RepID=A0A7W9B9S2_9SPHN|nr:FAD-dependent monooxygenase [Sphingopyxis panaciterrulae]MBB5708652.1 3-(3-hydroxy-phenyl)propionate hydroxylase [Sphingopyxis panaciterrulae]
MIVRTRVLVVGAGPVGVTAAYRLAQMGIDAILLEANADCPEDMRASTFHPPSLEMMAELGVLDELEAAGLRAPVYQYRNRRTGNRVELDLAEIGDATPYPYRLQCEQFKLSRLLSTRLDAHPHGRSLFQRRILGIAQDTAGVTVSVESPLAIEQYRADYVIAADGANSTIRKWLDIEFEGFTYPERFLTLSTDYPIETHIEGLAHVNYVADSAEWCVLLRVPSLWRILVPAREDEDDETLLSDAKKNRVFAGLLGDDRPITTYHRTLYRVHQRVAHDFRKGRVILAGDAAHLNNPLGGFGMNSGIHDAWNITAKLREILLEGAEAEPLLDLYERQRRTITRQFVQSQTIKNKEMLEAEQRDGKSEQERKLERLATDADARRDYMLRQAMITSLREEAAIA